MTHSAPFPTRWNDNDQYGHVNNAVYYEAMDTTINTWLIGAGLVPVGGAEIAVCRSSSCDYLAPIAFPDAMRVGLRAARIGTTSITWELTIQREDTGLLLATGRFVHVLVDAATRRPVPVPPWLRQAVEAELTG